MTKNLKAGDAVSWKSHGGKGHGKVVKALTAPCVIKGHKVAASKDNPEYLVETGEGKRAAHKPSALKNKCAPITSLHAVMNTAAILRC